MYDRAGSRARFRRTRIMFVSSPVKKAKFALPSRNAEWQAKDAEWKPPKPPVSEFDLVTLVSAVLYHI